MDENQNQDQPQIQIAIRPDNNIQEQEKPDKEVKPKKKRGRKPGKKNKKEKEVKVIDKLSPIHKLFVKNYVECINNGTRAYRMTYPKASETTARINASKLLSKANIKQAIDEEYAEYFKNKDSEREKSETYRLIHSVAKTPISDIVDLEGRTLVVKDLKEIPEFAVHAIKQIEYIKKETQHGTDENIKITLHDKLGALKLRAQMQGLIDKDNNTQIDITVLPAERPDEK